MSKGMAMRTSSLLDVPLAGPEEETRLQRRQDSFRKSLPVCLCFVNPSPCSHGEPVTSLQTLHPWKRYEKQLASLKYRAGAGVGTVGDPEEGDREDREGGRMP